MLTPPPSPGTAVRRRYSDRMVGDIWKTTNHYVVPKDARAVMAVIGAIGVYSKGQRFAWRGVSDADYELVSSLQRHVGGIDEEALRSAEVDVIQEARDWGLGTHPTGRVDDLQLLADLQHFGTPTRLIDVTSNPMTALWFACQPASTPQGKSGLLLALNITDWPRLSTVPDGSRSYGQVGRPESFRLEAALQDGRPHVVGSGAPNARIRAQEGFFVTSAVPDTLPMALIDLGSEQVAIRRHSPFRSLRVDWQDGVDPEVLEQRLLKPKRGQRASLPFVAVIIKAGLKANLLSYLGGTYNRSAQVLFPDYQGYVEHGERIRSLRTTGGSPEGPDRRGS